MTMIWTTIAAGLSIASSFASCLTMLHLRYRWDVHASSVRWLFWYFFLCVCVRCIMRSVFFVWMSHQPASQRVDESDPHSWTYGQLDRLGVHGIQFLPQAKSVWITIIIGTGDLALFGIALSLFPLAYELCRLARIAMDRGVKKEQAQIRRYSAAIGSGMALYAIALVVLADLYDGYNRYTQRCLLGVYGLQVVGLVYMISQLVLLKRNGRNYETIQGAFVASPVYQRLKHIMLVYAFFAFQFHISVIVIYLNGAAPTNPIMNVIGIGIILNNSFGLALSITTSCSQACVFHACSRCLPEDLEAQFHQQRLAEPRHEDLEAPHSNPVFVYTDIQSSTALWNTDGKTMSAAIEIHDTILRSSLLKHRGYEITTVGDAFQVAFHTIRDAVEYCMDVQLQLLVAKWPKEIHDLVPATTKARAGRRVIFSGLRVRMGIHDASEEEGRLVNDVHAITGKTTYSGMSEIIAEYVGELGSGGQILLTDRVATWLKQHRQELTVDIFMEYLGEYTVPQVSTSVEIYQLQPAMLATRAAHFAPPAHTDEDAVSPERTPWRLEYLRTRSGHPLFGARDITTESEELSSIASVEEADSPTTEEPFKLLRSPQPMPALLSPPPLEMDLAFAA